MSRNSHRELVATWEHYRFTPDGSYGTAQGAVAHNFWVSIFSLFFFITLSVLMCFLLYILFCSYVFGCLRRATTRRTTNKVVKDAILYACIQANNTYYKKVLGEKMNKKLGSSHIYLTEDQYNQVNICMSFYIQCLLLVFT
jgi:hypothetical protein